MSVKNTFKLDSGYTKTGVFWEVHKYNLRFATLYEVRVNGQTRQFRKKRECYKHLSDTNVVKFREQVDNDGNRHYFPVMEEVTNVNVARGDAAGSTTSVNSERDSTREDRKEVNTPGGYQGGGTFL